MSHIEKRWERARKLMMKNNIDCLYTTAGPDQRYLSGWSAFDPGWPVWLYPFILPLEGDPVFILTPMSVDIMNSSPEKTPVKDVRTYIDGQEEDAFKVLQTTLKDLGVEKGTIGVRARMNYADYEILENAAQEATIKNAQDIYDKLRMVKDEVEVGYMRKAGELTDIGFKLMTELARPGVSVVEVDLEIAKEKAKAGAQVNIRARSGQDPSHVYKKGDIIDNEAGSRYKGYGTDCARNIFVGEPTKRQKKMYEATKLAYEAVEPLVRPGVTMHELDLACREAMKEGLKDIIPNYTQPWKVGHGVGLGGPGHEAPLVQEGNMIKCEPRMIFVIDPGVFSDVFEPRRGYACPIHIEKTVLVTKNGCEPLDKFHHELVVV